MASFREEPLEVPGISSMLMLFVLDVSMLMLLLSSLLVLVVLVSFGGDGTTFVSADVDDDTVLRVLFLRKRSSRIGSLAFVTAARVDDVLVASFVRFVGDEDEYEHDDDDDDDDDDDNGYRPILVLNVGMP